MLKMIALSIAYPITVIFNKSIANGIFQCPGNLPMLYLFRKPTATTALATTDQYLSYQF